MGSLDKPILSEVRGEVFEERPSIWAAFAASVAANPDNLALACVHQPPGLFDIENLPLDDDSYRERPYLRWSFRSVHDAVLRLVRAWRALGVREGATLVTFMQNEAEIVLASWAALAMNCNYMPISPRNLTNSEEAIHMLKTGLSIAGGIKPVVLAQNEHLAKAIDDLGVLQEALKILAATESPNPESDWLTFRSLMDSAPVFQDTVEDVSTVLGPAPSETGGSIMFTSGTTSLPKGVYQPYQTNLTRVFHARHQPEGFGNFHPSAKVISNLPNNHAMGWACMNGLQMGTALIFPGESFEPTLMLDTMFAERATHTVLVPPMVHALAAVKARSAKFKDRPLSDVENVSLAGALVTPDVLKLLVDTLGVRGVEICFGCTEGLVTSSTCTEHVEKITDGVDVSVGWPLRGYSVRVVDPETGEVVPRGVLGEVHGSGVTVLGEYIGGRGKDAWYRDANGVVWYKTGDQARMDERGRLFITGRYKDMIVRGGENISPSAVEAVLSKNALLNPLLPQIVGVKDAIAGEVPLAVIRGSHATPEVRDAVQVEIVAHMGALYVPEDVISTEDLGIDDYPRTVSGKIQKVKLTALVNDYLSKMSQNGNGQSNGTLDEGRLTEEVKTIWARAVGLDPSHIRIDVPVGEFADSITVMRVREKIKRQTGKTLALQDMLEADTIEKQIDLMRAMETSSSETKTTVRKRPLRQGPLGVEDMAHLAEDPGLLEPTKKLVTGTIAKHGFDWEDVEDVIPAYDFNALMSQTRLNDDWTWFFAMQPAAKVSKQQLRRALEAVITNNRILGSFMVWDPTALGTDVALHVVMKKSPTFFDLIIEDGGQVQTLDDLKNVAENPPRPDIASFPGPLYRTLLFEVKETGETAMAISANHAVIDASMMQMVQEDLDRALAAVLKSPQGSATDILSHLHQHVDYKPWADSYFNLRTSAEARAATKWHVKRLQSLAKHVEAGALFPAKPATSIASRRLAVGLEPVSFRFDVPDIRRLRREHPHISATVVLKAAVALANVKRTGCAAAVFGNLEAARKYFPFQSRAVLEQVGAQLEATDVSGPAYQMVFNVVEVDRSSEETVLTFLERMQAEQTDLTKYAAAPLREVMRGLEQTCPGAGELLPRIMDTQHFNWVPGLGAAGAESPQQVKMLAAVNRPTIGLSVHAGLGGQESQTVVLNLYGDGVYIGKEEVTKTGECVRAITLWLVSRGNWETPVADVVTGLKSL